MTDAGPLPRDGRVVVVGTAGHVDHGKSTLVRALTGTDPDRLAEEKRRGLTIELGFAWCRLDGGTLLSLVDVPGHEDFIRNMLAGAGAVDAAILVVAADEGPMPQTLEHLAILDLVGIQHAVVALTKADLVEPDWLELVAEELRETLAGTSLAQAPILPVSAETGQGLEDFKSALQRTLDDVPEPAMRGRPRLPVDRSFVLDGFGAVVTGTLRDGSLRPGDPVRIEPSGQEARIRGLQALGRSVEEAQPGSRTAVNLAGIDAADIRRGEWLVLAEHYRPSRLIDVWLEVLPGAPLAVEHDLAVHLFHGASEIPGHVRVLGRREIAPGEAGPAQIRLERPGLVAAGDRFVLRLPSPAQTVGGGRILDPQPPGRRRRFDERVLQRFEDLQSAAPKALAWHMLAELEPCRAEALSPARTGLEAPERDAALAALETDGRALKLGERWISDRGWQRLRRRAEIVLARYHKRFPLRVGPPLEELRERLRLDSEVFPEAVARGIQEGWLARQGDLLHQPEHSVAFSEEQDAAAKRLLAQFRRSPFSTPSVKEAEAAVGPDVLAALLARGELVQVSAEVLFDRQGMADLRDGVLAQIDEQGQVTVADLRDRYDTSRKYALALLEHLDRLRLTRRQGDARVRMQSGQAGVEQAG